VWAAVHTAGTTTSDHLTLSLVANCTSIVATGILWVVRYVVLDRLLFAKRTLDPGVEAPSSVPAQPCSGQPYSPRPPRPLA
jgi:hypothetical protein